VLSGKSILDVKDAMGHAEETTRSILRELQRSQESYTWRSRESMYTVRQTSHEAADYIVQTSLCPGRATEHRHTVNQTSLEVASCFDAQQHSYSQILEHSLTVISRAGLRVGQEDANSSVAQSLKK